MTTTKTPRIVLIDDDPEEHILIRRQLKDFKDLKLVCFVNVRDAIGCLGQEPPDLVLLDARGTEDQPLAETTGRLTEITGGRPIVIISTTEVSWTCWDDKVDAHFILKDNLSAHSLSPYL